MSAIAMKTGTIASNAFSGRTSSSTAPVIPPRTEATAKRSVRLRPPSSSRRYPTDPATEPGTSPIVFETFAVTGE